MLPLEIHFHIIYQNKRKDESTFFDLVSKHPKVKNVKQETLRGRGGIVSKIDYDTDKKTHVH